MSCDATSALLLACLRVYVLVSLCVCFVVLTFPKHHKRQHAVDPSQSLPCFVRRIVCDADSMLATCSCICTMCDPSIHSSSMPNDDRTIFIHQYTQYTHTSTNQSSVRRKSNVCMVQFTHAPFGRLYNGFSYTLALFNNPSFLRLLHATKSYRVLNKKRFANGLAQSKKP